MLRLNPGELGVANFTGSTGVVYPNPTTGVCTLQLQDYKTVNAIAVYDMMGRGVYNNNFNKNSNDNNIKLDLTGYPSGVYLVEVKTNNGVMKEKIIKK